MEFIWCLLIALIAVVSFLAGYLKGRRERPVQVVQLTAPQIEMPPAKAAVKSSAPNRQWSKWVPMPVIRKSPDIIEVDFKKKARKPKDPDQSGPKGAA